MISTLTAVWNRLFAVLGRLSMYRLVVLSLAALGVIALALSFTGFIAPSPTELLVSMAVLGAACAGTDALAHRFLRSS